jgi:Protochlamydia outer membrane protein
MTTPHYDLQISVGLFFFALATTVQANPSQPKLNMVIFNQPPQEPAPQPLVIEQENSKTALQMVIFNQDAAVQETANSAASASQVEPTQEASTADDFTTQVRLKTGYQRNDLNWTIAATNGKPNILSELQWKKIESAMLETGVTITYADSWQAEANFGYGYTVNGRNQDSDYDLNDRQGEFSRSYSISQDGSIFNISGALGYRLMLGNKSNFALNLTPKIGYAYHTQQFGDSHAVQTIPASGNFGNGGLNKTYDASWFGPWAGLNAEMLFAGRLSLQSSIAYHLAKYEGTGNWMLRGDFQHPTSFRHSANGAGIVASSSVGYLINPEWTVRLSADYQHWKARNKGIDTTYFSNGGVGETKLNQVNWNSYGFNLGIEYHF